MAAFNSTIFHSVPGEGNQFLAGAFGIAAILATTAVYYAFGSRGKEHEFPRLSGIQPYHAWNFFKCRYDFLKSSYERNSGKGFYFNILQHKIIALTGEDARQVFFGSPHLNVDEGYKILMGAVSISLAMHLNGLLISKIPGSPDEQRDCGNRRTRGRELRTVQQEVKQTDAQNSYRK